MLRFESRAQPDAIVDALRRRDRADVTVSGARRLADIHEHGTNLVVWRRNLSVLQRAWLEQLARSARFHVELHVDAAGDGAVDLVAMIPASPERGWLQADLRRLVRRFASLTGAATVKASFGVVETNACRKLHADWVPLRLMCTYAGPGTDWVLNSHVRRPLLADPPACPDEANAAIVPDAAAIRRARTGDVLVMKGETYPGNTGNGAVHRSPPVERTGERRLVLKLTV